MSEIGLPPDDGRDGGEPATRRRDRVTAGRRQAVPWPWIILGVIALVLVGRGVVGAGLRPGADTPSAAFPPGNPSDAIVGPTTSNDPFGSPGVGQSTGPSPTVDPSLSPTVDPTPQPTHDRIALPLASTTTPFSPPAPAAPPAPATSAAPAAPATSKTSVGQPAPTTSPAAVLQCSARAEVTSYWGGYNAVITLRNTGRTQINGWTVTFTLPEGQMIVNSWNVLLTMGQNRVWASDVGHNATLPPGGSTQIGYQAQADWPLGPSGFVLNGAACTT